MADGLIEALAVVTRMLGCVLGTEQDAREVRAALATLRRHLEPQPIESAPRDGTRVLLFPTGWNDNTPEIGFWDTEQYSKKPRPFWNYDRWQRTISRGHQPTHWLPLPAPANQEG